MEKGRSGAELSSKRFLAIVFGCFISLSLFLIVIYKPTTSTFDPLADFSKAPVSGEKTHTFLTSSGAGAGAAGSKSNPSPPPTADKLLGGLLSPTFDEDSCISRYRSYLYRKTSPHKLSPYLISKLREYERLHKRCGPNTAIYNTTIQTTLNSTNYSTNTTNLCNYIVWLPSNGLGNRIISMTATFLYAVLTNRVLLVHHGTDMADLFCEPFPETSWLLPPDFPLTNRFDSKEMRDVHSYGNLLKANNLIASSIALPPPPFLYLYLACDYDENDKLFYRDENQDFLKNVPWLLMRTGQYFAPSLFFMPSFKNELEKLFPDKETVFHHLARYLFHPSNQTWGLITRFYQAYLENADERIGFQIRVYDTKASPSNRVMDQILTCIKRENILPQPGNQKLVAPESKNLTRKAVLITSLFPEYYENLRNMYWMRPTETGEVVGFFQPSHETDQQFGDNMHNIKAWAEIYSLRPFLMDAYCLCTRLEREYLLSYSDVLVTSWRSTFGYVAHGLAGLKPRTLFMPYHKVTPDPPCPRDISMEPCYHNPPSYDRITGKSLDDTKALIPNVRHCMDVRRGIKLVNNIEQQ